MAYKLIDRLIQDEIVNTRFIWKQMAGILILFSMLGFVTAFIFTLEKSVISRKQLTISNYLIGRVEVIGPIQVKRRGEAYSVSVRSLLPADTWSFVEGEVLDANREFIFSFGKELWHEVGYDTDGRWDELDTAYKMNITFPKTGKYYIAIKVESSATPTPAEIPLEVSVARQFGSGIPHFVFGIFCLLTGLIINECLNRTVRRFIRSMRENA